MPRLVAEETDASPSPRGARASAVELAVARAEADHEDLETFEVAQERRRPDERVEILGVTDVPGVHDDERVVDALLSPTTRSAGAAGRAPTCRPSSGSPRPVRSAHPSARADPSSSPRSRRRDRRDGGRAPTSFRSAPSTIGCSRRLTRSAISGKTSWLITSSGDAEPPGDEEPDVADHRRVGHAEHEVGPLASERREHRVAEVARVVHRPPVELRALVRRRANADDAHAVPRLLERQVLAVQAPRHDGDVVVGARAPRRAATAAAPSPRRPASSTG